MACRGAAASLATAAGCAGSPWPVNQVYRRIRAVGTDGSPAAPTAEDCRPLAVSERKEEVRSERPPQVERRLSERFAPAGRCHRHMDRLMPGLRRCPGGAGAGQRLGRLHPLQAAQMTPAFVSPGPTRAVDVDAALRPPSM